MGLLDRYAARKRRREKEAEWEAEGFEESVRPPMDGGLEIQTIVILASLEMGSNDQPSSKNIAREKPREEALIPPPLQVVHPSERMERCLGATGLTLTGRKRSLLSD